MMTLKSHLVALLMTSAMLAGQALSQDPGLRVREIDPLGGSAGSWGGSALNPSRFELKMVNVQEHEWVVIVPSISIVDTLHGGASPSDISKFTSVLPWLENLHYTRADMAATLHEYMNPASHAAMSPVPTSSIGATDPAVYSTFCNLFADLGVSVPEDIVGAGIPVPAGATELVWLARDHSGWEPAGGTTATGTFWNVGTTPSGTAPLAPSHHASHALAKQVMFYQAARHLGPTITPQHIDILWDSLQDLGVLLTVDFVPMIITGTGGAGPITTGGTEPRPLVGLPTGLPTIRLGEPVSVTVLPGFPVNPLERITVIPMPAPFPSIWPYIVGDSMNVELNIPASNPTEGAISAHYWDAINQEVSFVPCARNEDFVIFHLPSNCLGGLVTFKDSTDSPYLPKAGGYLSGIFSFPVAPPPASN